MLPDDLASLYGPPALSALYRRGERISYIEEEYTTIRTGQILYVAAGKDDHDLHYIVTPDVEQFPTPVWPEQVIGLAPEENL